MSLKLCRSSCALSIRLCYDEVLKSVALWNDNCVSIVLTLVTVLVNYVSQCNIKPGS